MSTNDELHAELKPDIEAVAGARFGELLRARRVFREVFSYEGTAQADPRNLHQSEVVLGIPAGQPVSATLQVGVMEIVGVRDANYSADVHSGFDTGSSSPAQCSSRVVRAPTTTAT